MTVKDRLVCMNKKIEFYKALLRFVLGNTPSEEVLKIATKVKLSWQPTNSDLTFLEDITLDRIEHRQMSRLDNLLLNFFWDLSQINSPEASELFHSLQHALRSSSIVVISSKVIRGKKQRGDSGSAVVTLHVSDLVSFRKLLEAKLDLKAGGTFINETFTRPS